MLKNKWWSYIGIVFMLLVSTYLYVSGQYKPVYIAIRSMNKGWLTLGFLFIVFYWLIESNIIHLLINKLYRKKTFKESLKISMIGQFFSGITPFASGGQPAQLILLKQQDIPIGIGSTILMSKFVVYQGVLVVYAGLLLVFKAKMFLTHINNLFLLVLVGFGVNLMVIGGLVFLSLSKRMNNKLSTILINILHKIKMIKDKRAVQLRISENIDDFHKQIKILSQHKLLVCKMIMLTILQLTCYFLVPYCLYRGFGLTGVSVIDIIAATAFVLMVTSFVPMPGGSGGAEGGFYVIFGMFFIGQYILPALLVWRVITYYMWMVIGGIWMFSANTNYVRS